jgi:hypothetical protein
MRRSILTAALLIALSTLPVWAQHRGMSAGPRGGTAIGARPGGRVVVRGGVGFGHSPQFGVFVGSRSFHHRRFFRPFPFGFPFASGYPFYTAYPYYPYGLQSDFVYSNFYNPDQQAMDYNRGQNAVVVSDLQRLQSELDQMKQQQAIERERYSERQQYAMSSPTAAPRPIPSSRQEAPVPPTVLVFRDSHKLEVSNYAVAGQTLWIFSQERARKVPLADLDLNATRQVNEERGVEFAVQPKSSSR